MIQIDKMSRQPLYAQMIKAIENEILMGYIKEGEKISSVRDISRELSVNPNTIQKAFLDLDRRGIISSSPGIGTFVAEKAKEKIQKESGEKLDDLHNVVYELAIARVPKKDVVSTIDKAYKKAEETLK